MRDRRAGSNDPVTRRAGSNDPVTRRAGSSDPVTRGDKFAGSWLCLPKTIPFLSRTELCHSVVRPAATCVQKVGMVSALGVIKIGKDRRAN